MQVLGSILYFIKPYKVMHAYFKCHCLGVDDSIYESGDLGMNQQSRVFAE